LGDESERGLPVLVRRLRLLLELVSSLLLLLLSLSMPNVMHPLSCSFELESEVDIDLDLHTLASIVAICRFVRCAQSFDSSFPKVRTRNLDQTSSNYRIHRDKVRVPSRTMADQSGAVEELF